jgi:hypothetical protein
MWYGTRLGATSMQSQERYSVNTQCILVHFRNRKLSGFPAEKPQTWLVYHARLACSLKIGRTALPKDEGSGGSVWVEGERCQSEVATLVAWTRSLTIRKLSFPATTVLSTESIEESTMVLTA